MACRHNKRHTCKACKKAAASKQAKVDKNARLALTGQSHKIEVTTRPEISRWRTYEEARRRARLADEKLMKEAGLSRSKLTRLDRDFEWPGLQLIEDPPPRALRLVKSLRRKYHLLGVYELVGGAEKDAEGEIVWHGTSARAVMEISRVHFRSSVGGMLGRGIYVSTSRSKAWGYSKGFAKALVMAKLTKPGKVLHTDDFASVDMMLVAASKIVGPVTLHAENRVPWAWGKSIRNPEYCVRYASQLSLVCAFLFVKK